jgi:hypothetical protein
VRRRVTLAEVRLGFDDARLERPAAYAAYQHTSHELPRRFGGR